jgi:DNA-binding phage protein
LICPVSDIAPRFEAVIEDGDAGLVAATLENIARAEGMGAFDRD